MWIDGYLTGECSWDSLGGDTCCALCLPGDLNTNANARCMQDAVR